ncbi:putative double C2-like domain-containing protein beta-like [Penaeus vannamei]|uniref:Putative double C2-like domain-containing protein beta-like n=1 Tax=Penaeus vannamei TaxID=6689 RepID=A0A3R7MK57_PENVA|nr:putative double C2-like domain-containing protein beta-like [Penaeus vannamei]
MRRRRPSTRWARPRRLPPSPLPVPQGGVARLRPRLQLLASPSPTSTASAPGGSRRPPRAARTSAILASAEIPAAPGTPGEVLGRGRMRDSLQDAALGLRWRRAEGMDGRESDAPYSCQRGNSLKEVELNGDQEGWKKLRDSRDSLVSRDSSMRDEVTSSSVDEVFTDERHVNSNNIQDQKEKEATTGLGLVEFSLLYDSHNQALHCTVHSARNLRPADSGSQADPYVKLHLLPGASKSNKLRTRTIPKTVNPDFNETLTYYGISDQDMARKTLRLTILDEDRFSCDFLGEARIALKKVRPHETKRLRINLEKRAILKPDPTHKKYRTAVKWKNLNPEFNEEFVFEVRRNELPKKLLDIRVYDKDVGRSDDFIGGLQLSQDSTGSELRHWYDALQYPDRRHDRWHQLQPLNGK